jgi:hypothetical protein
VASALFRGIAPPARADETSNISPQTQNAAETGNV